MKEYIAFDASALGQILKYISFFWFLYYLWNVIVCIVDFIRNLKNRGWKWIIIAVLIPVVGTYLYYYKYVFKKLPIVSIENSEKINIDQIYDKINTVNLAWRRLLAALLDQGIYLLFVIGYTLLFGIKQASGNIEIRGLYHGLILFVVWFMWLPFMENRFGSTFGKKILNVMVVNKKLQKPTIGKAFIRHLFDIIDIVYFLINFIRVSKKMKIPRRIGDYISGTYVIPKKVEGLN